MTAKGALSKADVEALLLDPGSAFSEAEDVLAHRGLSDAQRIEILRRWAYDVSEECVAVEEGMPGGGDGALLQGILVALKQLGAEVDVDQVGPSKQHGIPRSAVKPD